MLYYFYQAKAVKGEKMINQTEIREETLLLNDKGELNKPGWCRRNLYTYNRESILPRLRWRTKEWDFYQVSNDRYMVQICFFNISIATAGNATLVDLKTGRTVKAGGINLFTMDRFIPPRNGDKPYELEYKQGKNHLKFQVSDRVRKIHFSGKSKGQDFVLDFEMDMLPNHESITIATPFEKKGRFFYTQKINCMPTQGTVKIGNEIIDFSKEDTYGVLDWGRGVWPHKNAWYWGNGSTTIDGKLFGFELTWGFGKETAATETAIFYDGKCHKISAVDVETFPKGRWMEPWHFVSEDKRFDMTMKPFYDNETGAKILGLLGAKCHQVHGYWSGKVVLDDGKELFIDNMYAFCEYMENLW